MERLKAILLLAATLAFVTSPIWSGGFGGFEPGQFPVPQDHPPVQPAAYAFSIWGLIYLWLVAHAGFGLLRRDRDPDWDRPRWPLIGSLVVGTPWIAVATMSPVWATVLIVLMLAGALGALLSIAPGRDRWLLAAPVAIYAGWLTAATAVSLALLAGGYGILSTGIAAWLAVVLLVAVAATVQRAVPAFPEYGLTVGWALIAVLVRNWGGDWALAGAAAAATALLAGIALGRRGPVGA